MENTAIRGSIAAGQAVMGLELGSTRIKAVLIGPDHTPIASGSYDWENRLEEGIWTYHLEDVWTGIQKAYAELAENVRKTYGVPLTTLKAMGFSGMMHGYLPFDAEGNQLAPFRTWRNTTTAQAAAELTERLQFNIPQRWSISHLDQAILNGEEHVKRISYLTTLAGYVHWKLTGEKVMGVGEASGMFPIDSETCDFHETMVQQFDALLKERELPFTLREILPKVLPAGAPAGTLTAEGAALLDPSGTLQPGIPLCPPEGDAGTGMVATNSVRVHTGNVSAGTSVFAMIVLDQPLSKVYPEIDLVTTPAGKAVAMAHCNTCTSDLDAWVRLFGETIRAAGLEISKPALYDLFYQNAFRGDPDCGGLVNVNYFAGEPVTRIEEGRPLFVRRPDASFTLPNFARAQLYSAMATLKIGMDLLLVKEKVQVETLLGHGGLFKTPVVGQKLLAGALNIPVAVMETAGEGGPWGMALLAAYLANRKDGETLEDYLAVRVFAGAKGSVEEPDPADTAGFAAFLENYQKALAAEQAAAAL